MKISVFTPEKEEDESDEFMVSEVDCSPNRQMNVYFTKANQTKTAKNSLVPSG
jgi:hypothetical protein